MNNNDETIPATVARLLAKQRNDEDPPPTAPGQARMPDTCYEMLTS